MVGRLRHEAGQTVVLFALLLPLFLGLGALAVDVGYWYVVKKEAQDAADAAALAAARELPNRDAAVATAITYVRANMPDAPTPSVEFPYIPDDSVPGQAEAAGSPTIRRSRSRSATPPERSSAGCSGSSPRRSRGGQSPNESRVAASRSIPTSTDASRTLSCSRATTSRSGDTFTLTGATRFRAPATRRYWAADGTTWAELRLELDPA